MTAEYWIDHLMLEAHPEGGFFRETYRSADAISQSALPDRFSGDRSASTGIYFLLRSGEFSHLHRIASDEMWHFYAGSSLTVHVIHSDGRYESIALGADVANGESFQAMVPAGAWFGATVDQPDSYALVGCTVAPGFDFADFEMADRAQLTTHYPEHRSIIELITK
ncbi:MAG: cupin domain-containing protein [Verrucomicrobiota bacterium]